MLRQMFLAQLSFASDAGGYPARSGMQHSRTCTTACENWSTSALAPDADELACRNLGWAAEQCRR